MIRKCSFIACMALVLAFLVLLPVQARAPEPFERTGVIDLIARNEERIVIYDVNYRFPTSTPVYVFIPQGDNDNPEKRKRVAQESLRVGMHVGYTVAERHGSTRHPLITEMWILPQDNVRPKRQQEPVRTPSKR
jgi:hypothetical protein